MNGVNIQLFQFDYDLTWMAFFMDANDRFYARYGGRDDTAPESHLSKASLVKTMQEVLRLHQEGEVQTSRYEPGPEPIRLPEHDAALHARIKARKPENRCIHCHDVKQSELTALRQSGKFSRDRIFGYPMPEVLGLKLKDTEQSRIDAVLPDTPARKAGLQPGDILRKLDGQRILTAADMARVLDQSPRQASLPLEFERAGKPHQTKIELAGEWRRSPDPSWRSSTYVAGPNSGFWAVPLTAAERQQTGLAADKLGLRVSFFFKGQDAPQRSGIKMNDVIVEFDGKREPWSTRQLQTHLQMNHEYGGKVPMTVRRDGKEYKLTLELPKKPPEMR